MGERTFTLTGLMLWKKEALICIAFPSIISHDMINSVAHMHQGVQGWF